VAVVETAAAGVDEVVVAVAAAAAA